MEEQVAELQPEREQARPVRLSLRRHREARKAPWRSRVWIASLRSRWQEATDRVRN